MDTVRLKGTEARTEMVEGLPLHAREDVEIELLHDANRSFHGREILGREFARPALAPPLQAPKHPADVVGAVADDGEINPAAGVFGQLPFVPGSSLPRRG